LNASGTVYSSVVRMVIGLVNCVRGEYWDGRERSKTVRYGDLCGVIV